MNKNIMKSVVFAAVVLVAGIVAMQVIYNNVTGDADTMAGYQPAAGEEAEGEVNYDNNETFMDDVEDAGDAMARDAEEAAEEVEEAVEEMTEETDEAAEEAEEEMEDAAEEAEEAAEEAHDHMEEKTAE